MTAVDECYIVFLGSSILEEDLAKNVSLSLHNSFCLNREARVKALPNQAKRLQEQREWMRSYEQLKAWEEIVISSDDEEELLRQFAASSKHNLANINLANINKTENVKGQKTLQNMQETHKRK